MRHITLCFLHYKDSEPRGQFAVKVGGLFNPVAVDRTTDRPPAQLTLSGRARAEGQTPGQKQPLLEKQRV